MPKSSRLEFANEKGWVVHNKENIVLITVDCLRADHLSLYGYKKNNTPNIDGLASEGVTFTEAIANGSHTAISFPSILTSTYGSMYGGYDCLSNERMSIAQVLSKNGYTTAAFHSNPHLSAAYNYDIGFNVFSDSFENKFFSSRFNIFKKWGDSARFRTLFSFMMKLYSHVYGKRTFEVPYERAEGIARKAIDWLQGSSSNFFIWVHFMDPHWPWIPPKDFLNEMVSIEEANRLWWKMSINYQSLSHEELRKLIGLYDCEIRYVDHALGDFLRVLKERGLYDNSIIILTSDHGEEFEEHGDIGHHSLKMYEELIHVPLVIKFPNGLYKGTIANDLVSLLDLAPTIVERLGIDKPKKWLGSSLLPILAGKKGYNSEGVISEGRIKKGHNIVSYRSKQWKFIINEEKGMRELYDLQQDPSEKKNLAKVMPEKVAEFEAEVTKHLSKAKESYATLPKIDEDEHLRQRLKALGYS